jgi:arabinan endo-1,5-alpha-L-arabinosidase
MEPTGAIRHVHDPVLQRCGNAFYLFSTGNGIPIRRSTDLIHWDEIGRVFESDFPTWATEPVPGVRGVWAPDISHWKGLYRLYYSVSTFGSNRSAIGLAVNKTLDPKSKDYRWDDKGPVFASVRTDPYNAIDPAFAVDERGNPFLAYGSFWTGLYLLALDPTAEKPAPGARPQKIAARPEPPDAIEAPFLYRRGRWWYLLVSFDFCCRGERSTYNLRIGRSQSLTGPYIDRAGKPLIDGGGTILREGSGTMRGPGHGAIVKDGRRELLVHHFYDGTENYVPTLAIAPLKWTRDGWPEVATDTPR